MVSCIFGHVFGHVLPCGMPFGDKNAHGIPFEAIPLSPSHAGGERKRKSCGVTSEHKGADTRIFGQKGNGVARPPCHFPQLGEKGRWVAQPQQGKVPTRGFSAKKETVVARPEKSAKYSLFLCVPAQIK